MSDAIKIKGTVEKIVRAFGQTDAQVTITEDKGLVYGKVLFDDWPNYITRWLKWRKRGLVLMLDHPWNQSFFHPNVIRIKGPEDFPRVEEALAARAAA